MRFTEKAWPIFDQVLEDYHRVDSVDAHTENPYAVGSLEHLLYHKCWIDTVQWHLEDIIRDANINAEYALAIKRRIDSSNQERTDIVEQLDDYFLTLYNEVEYHENYRLNTESPAWAVDRLSILALKIYHMTEQVMRTDVTTEHQERCADKLHVLKIQRDDLMEAIDTLLEDIGSGAVRMKVYRQMKMYNDATLNPILYKNKDV